MRKLILTGAGLLAAAVLPAFADGYRNAPPPNPGPAPLSPHETRVHHPDKEVHVVRIRREVEPAYTVSSSCGCCCAPASYSRSYTTEPVVVRTYTRTYTRMAPPSCGYSPAYRHHDGAYQHDHHEHHQEMHGGMHHQEHHGDGYYHESRYHDGRYAHQSWQDQRERYAGPHGDAPPYGENRIIWTEDGTRKESTYTARRDGYSYYQAWAN